jgi:pimeloyl-ACP methyl ester carboxylesterase
MEATATRTIPLYIDDGGAGDSPPVVFVHSLGGLSGQWATQLAHLRRTRRALAVDLRGHGNSPAAPDGDYGIETLAADLAAALDELELPRFVLVGHSLGGSVAMAYAGAHPEQLAGLFLADPSGDASLIPREQAQGMLAGLDGPDYEGYISGYYNMILAGASEATRAQVLADLLATPQTAVSHGLKALFKYSPQPAMQRYTGPTMVVYTPANESPISLHKLRPDLPAMALAETSHWLQLDRPLEFNQLLESFLAEL